MPKSIWVVAEQWRGQLSEITYELLALGEEVARQLGAPLQAVLLGHHVKQLAGTLGRAGTVLYVDHPTLAEPIPGSYAAALSYLIKERQPRAVLIPMSNVSLGVVTLVAARLQAPGINFCKDVRVVDGQLQAHCVLYGGKMEATVSAAGEPLILGVSPGARPPEKGRAEQTPAIEEPAVVLPEVPGPRLKQYIEPEARDVDITRPDALVAVGRGIQNQDDLALAEELAQALGGAVCGSRPVIDQGWLPLTRQVGRSGLIVKPKLYLAAGISGAPEHVEGMKDAGLIIAINTDPQAPIFDIAHYGIVADCLDVLAALTEAVRAGKG